MKDLNPDDSLPNSPMPEAGRDPADPLAPEIEEEANPDAPITNAEQDVEVTGANEIDKDDDDDDDDLSDNDSLLSDVDETQFQDFDPNAISLEDRQQIAIDDDNVKLLGVHKRKRTEAEIEASKKRKQEKRREKPKKVRRRREGSEPFSGGEEISGKRRNKRQGGDDGETRAAPTRKEVDESNLSPEERRRRALDRAMDEALRNPNARRKKRDGIDLEQAADEEVAQMRRRMEQAASADAGARERGEPAMSKLQLLPDVSALLNRGGAIQQSLVDPDNGLLDGIRFFLEPTAPDGSLPAYNIQKDMFAVLPKLPIGVEELRGCKLGQVVLFYTKSKKPEPAIKRQAERLLRRWMGLILKRSDDYRQRDPAQANGEGNGLAIRPSQMTAGQLARERELETPSMHQNRARVQGGVGTYTIAPKSQGPVGESLRAPGHKSEAAFRKIQQRQQGRGGGGGGGGRK